MYMDGQQPSFELPTPVGAMRETHTDAAPQRGSERNPVTSPEIAGAQAPMPGAIPAQHAPVMPSFDPSQATQAPTGQSVQTQHSPASPVFADDVDVIEKEWVKRAKVIVEMTRDDPHQQNKQLSAYKADYVRKRYNKELKVAE